MNKNIEIIAKAFLNYSLTEIEFEYEGLTKSEKAICTREEFEKLVEWIKSEN